MEYQVASSDVQESIQELGEDPEERRPKVSSVEVEQPPKKVCLWVLIGEEGCDCWLSMR